MASIVLLLDTYSKISQMLEKSLEKAEIDFQTVVINDNGYLGENAISIYRYFCGNIKESEDYLGHPRYFNQVKIPDYWEIKGKGSEAEIYDKSKLRGKIFYKDSNNKRNVSIVDWYDENGKARVSDHYDRYGVLYARTIFSKEGKLFLRSYFDDKKREIVVENFVTKDIILNKDNKVLFFKNKTDFTCFVLKEAGLDKKRLFYNTLSTPFFVSEKLEKGPEDVLFWQEEARNDIPGNMQIILSGKANRTEKIFVQDRFSFEKLVECGANKEKIDQLGFIYDFKKENKNSKNALICTNSDNIEKLSFIATALPELNIHIAALTEMSQKLLDMGKFQNITLYPGVKGTILDELFEKCDYYLDINHGAEIVEAVEKAFLNNMLILSIDKCVHNTTFTPKEHIYENHTKLLDEIKLILSDEKWLEVALARQRKHGMSVGKEEYSQLK